jgi:tRNA(Ile)-lysidine synthase
MNFTESDSMMVGGPLKKRSSDFAQRLFVEWKNLCLPVKDERILIAASGGADSTALVFAFAELIEKSCFALSPVIAHLDHGLREEAGARDAEWVAALAAQLGFDIVLKKVTIGRRATIEKDNLEQSARRARYEFLSEAATKCRARFVLTGHTMNDQAETVLLRLLRGSGAEGLSGIAPVRALFSASEGVQLARPLVRWARRSETENYCAARGVVCRFDEMNEDERFARVRVRRKLLPLLESFNPRAVEAIARAADLLRDDAATLRVAAARLLDEASEDQQIESSRVPMLRIDVLRAAPFALRRRALRQWIASGQGDLRRLELTHLLAVEKLLAGERGGRKALLPGGSFVERHRRWLRLHAAPRA